MTIKKLEDHVKSLVQDKMLLMDRCEATMAASAKHAEGERNARLESEKLRKEMQDSRKKYDHLKEKYRDLKNSYGLPDAILEVLLNCHMSEIGKVVLVPCADRCRR